MKKIILMLAVTFSFAVINAQETTNTKTKTEMKKSCSKDCKKSCCDKKSTTKKSCSSSKKSCSKTCTGSSSAYVKTVSAKEFMTYAKKFPAEQIIDIRTKKEVDGSGMIKGAVNIDYHSRDFKEHINNLDKDAAIMIYCNSGKRSSEVIAHLKSWGFKKIYELDGGYLAYSATFPRK